MERFIAEQNIKRFKRQMESCTDDAQLAQLKQLLAAEESKLVGLVPRPPLQPDNL